MAEPMSGDMPALTDTELAELAASIEHLSGPDAWEQDQLEPALIPVTHYVPRLLAEVKQLRKERDELLAHPVLALPAEADISEEDRQRWNRTWASLSDKVPDSTIVRLSRGVVTVPHDTPVSDDTLRALNQ